MLDKNLTWGILAKAFFIVTESTFSSADLRNSRDYDKQ